MRKHILTWVAVGLLLGASGAGAQNANPFKPAAQPVVPGATPGARTGPTNIPTPPPSLNVPQPFVGQPPVPGNFQQPFNGNPNVPPVPGIPGGVYPNMPEMGQPAPELEEFPATKVGKVNGHYIYRGQRSYLFEKAPKTEPAVKVVASAVPTGPAASSPKGGAGAPARPDLPSMVGKPNPR